MDHKAGRGDEFAYSQALDVLQRGAGLVDRLFVADDEHQEVKSRFEQSRRDGALKLQAIDIKRTEGPDCGEFSMLDRLTFVKHPRGIVVHAGGDVELHPSGVKGRRRGVL